MKKEIRENQAIYSHLLNFEPIHKRFVPPAPKSSIDPSAGSKVELPSAGLGLDGTYFPVRGVRTLDDGSIEVNFYAPNAKRVEIAGTGGSMQGRYDLKPLGDGYWQTVITDVGPGFHYHVYIVDGVMTFNPTVPFGFGNAFVLNYFEVPNPDEDFWLLKDVPHGSVRMELMKSEITGRYRNLWVYTPAGYDKSDKKYPVVHILHGGGENETGWFWQGKLNYIADNLIAEGKAEECIVVASSFAAPKENEDGTFTNENFSEVMVKEIVPFIDDNFRTIADREYRALCGLSAGGGMTRTTVTLHPETFANMGQFSSGGGFPVPGVTKTEGALFPGMKNTSMDELYKKLFSSPEEYNAKMKVTFISCGTDDPRHQYTGPQVAELREAGYNVDYSYYPGYHEWDVWRCSARDFLTVLFK